MCAEVAWVAKRWSRARLLKICIQQDNTKELLQALSCRETRNLACLEGGAPSLMLHSAWCR